MSSTRRSRSGPRSSASRQARGGPFRVRTNRGDITARRVVVATGSYHVPQIPPPAARIAPRVAQLHSHDYRNESMLPEGAVLVVGSGQTGVQLAEELSDAGRRVYLSVGTAGRAPRRYRGVDILRLARPDRAAGPRVRTRPPDGRRAPGPEPEVRRQPARLGTRRWPRYEPSAVRSGRDAARRTPASGRGRAGHLRR